MPRITDEEVSYKEKKVSGALDRVTAVLSGSKSGVFTKIAKRYKRIDTLLGKLSEEREKLNEQVKEKVADHFNEAELGLLTLVVESVSMTATLSKRTPSSTVDVEHFDAEAALNELAETLPEIAEQIEFLRKKHTIVSQVSKEAKSPALRVKFNESFEDDKVQEYAELVNRKVGLEVKKISDKLERIKQKM